MALVVTIEKSGDLASLDNWEDRAVMVPRCVLGTV